MVILRFFLKNCSPFIKCVRHLNDEHIETSENLNLVMNMYNLIEYSDSYSDTSGSLFQYKRDEQPLDNDRIRQNVTVDNSSSFKYKSNVLKGLTTRNVAAYTNPCIEHPHRLFLNAKIVVHLKYVSSFFRSLEIPLINTKLHFELNWTKNSVMSNAAADGTTFKITKTELYAPVVTLNTSDNLKLTKSLSKGLKRSVFWNEYKSKIQTETHDPNNLKRILLNASFQGVNRVFVAAFDNSDGNNKIEMNSHRKYVLHRINLTKFNVLIGGRNFYDQQISDKIRKYDESRKVTTGKGEDYTAGCLLDYEYFKNHYNIIACDIS